MTRERVRDVLRAAARQGPADRLRGQTQHHRKGCGKRFFQRERRMRGESREQATRFFFAEHRAREKFCRPKRPHAKVPEQERVARKTEQRSQNHWRERTPTRRERRKNS